MIATVRRHRQAGPLLGELYEPDNPGPRGIPHLVAGAREPAGLEPGRRRGSRSRSRSRGVDRLAGWLDEPLGLLPPGRPRRTAWHCTVQAHPCDRTLTDQQWAHIAGEIMHGAGLAPAGDTGAVRWVAARHGRDHIHIIATLARQDGTRPPAGNASGARNACHAAEDRYGLHSTRWTRRTEPGRPPGPALLSCRDLPAPVATGTHRAGPAAQRWLPFASFRSMTESR